MYSTIRPEGSMARNAKKLSVSIDRPAAEAYEFLCVPENFARWASGMQGTKVRFSERNAHGVLDHAVTTADGTEVYVPLRVRARGRRCELELTLFRSPDTTDEKFAADAQWVLRDLLAAKRLLEAR
jgi:hypothetical protein